MSKVLLQVKNAALIIIIGVSLAACGGSSGNSSDGNASGGTSNDPASAYTGKTAPTLLTRDNTAKFSQLLFGNNASADNVLSRPTGTTQQTPLNQPLIARQLGQLARRSITTNSSLSQRQVSDTEACSFGGTAKMEGNVDDAAGTGTINITFTDCQEDSDTTMNGKASVSIHSSEDPESFTLGFNDLNVKQGDINYSQLGTVQYYSDSQKDREVVNLTSKNIAENTSVFLENYTVETTFTQESNITNPSSITGKIYISDEGYITLASSDDLELHPNLTGALYVGHLYLHGASLSKARISPTLHPDGYITSEQYRLDLDSDGDNSYELTSIQTISATAAETALNENQTPEAVIIASKGHSFDGVPEFTVHETVYLSGTNSSDNEGDAISYAWTLESIPEGSLVGIEPVRNSDSIDFKPDVKGLYKVSLKVTDSNGSGKSNVSVIDIDTTNYVPELTINTDPELTIYVGGYSNGSIGFTASDYDTLLEYSASKLTLTYDLIEKPTGSNATISASSLNYQPNEEYINVDYETPDVGVVINADLGLSPDIVGIYRVRITATDEDGQSAAQVVTFNALSNIPTASSIICTAGCENGLNSVSKGSSVKLEIPSELNDSLGYYWRVYSDVTDGTGIPADENYSDNNYGIIEFVPTELGGYTIDVSYFDKYEYNSPWTTIQKRFTVID